MERHHTLSVMSDISWKLLIHTNGLVDVNLFSGSHDQHIFSAWICFFEATWKASSTRCLWTPKSISLPDLLLLLEISRTWLVIMLLYAIRCGSVVKLVLWYVVALSTIFCEPLACYICLCLFPFTSHFLYSAGLSRGVSGHTLYCESFYIFPL